MTKNLSTVILGTGSYIPEVVIPNSYFLDSSFYGPDRERIRYGKGEKEGQLIPNEEIIQKFEQITGIKERRYARDDQNTSDLASLAAEDALSCSGIDREELDYIIVAHNFGDIKVDNRRSDIVPNLASRVKQKLGIKNPSTITDDVIFGCPGWLKGAIQADYYIKSGDAKLVLCIGAENLPLVGDPHDRDTMIYSAGAGATIFGVKESEDPIGILSHSIRSDSSYMLRMERSYNPNYKGNELFLKMDGHDLYLYAIEAVPLVVKEALDRSGFSLNDLKKILIHQANDKMDYKIVQNFFKLYGRRPSEQEIRDIMPMTISWLGNSSVATLPTLLDLIMKGKVNNHGLEKGDIIGFSSVGGGMNRNALIYKVP